MALDTETLYYVNLPTETKSFLAEGIIPVVKSALGEDTASLKQVLYVKSSFRNKPEQVYTRPIYVNPPVDQFNRAFATTPGDDKQFIHLAGNLAFYMHVNDGLLKVLALNNFPSRNEESVLKRAVDFMNAEYLRITGNAKDIQLEELAVRNR